MIHRITIPAPILRDYEARNVFPRFHRALHHPMMSDISARVGRDELADMLADAEIYSAVAQTGSPKLTIAYVRFAAKAREMLRADPAPLQAGRDMKSAAAGEKDYEYD